MTTIAPDSDIDLDYRSLADFRYHLRLFLRFSEDASRQAGLEPQQHQLLLCLRAMPETAVPSVSALSERLQLKHHTVVELIDRLETKGFVSRKRDSIDQRRVLISLTEVGAALLETLSRFHQRELQTLGPALITSLTRIVANAENAPPAVV